MEENVRTYKVMWGILLILLAVIFMVSGTSSCDGVPSYVSQVEHMEQIQEACVK